MQKYGPILISQKSGTPFQSPYLNAMTTAMKQMREFAVEFGMTPSSRSRVHASGDESESDPLFQLLQSRVNSN